MAFRNHLRIFNQQIRCHSNSIYYTGSHNYIKKHDGFYTLGITKSLTRKIYPIIYTEFHVKPGEFIKKNQPLVLLESSVTSKTIISPIDCIIYNINKEIEDNNFIINSDPLNSGWLFKIFIKNNLLHNNNDLMNEDEYNKYIE